MKESQIEFDHKVKVLLQPLSSKEELQAWMHVFLDLWFPSGTVYPSSTHGPIDAMWRIYELMSTGEAENIPQVCMLASRDSFKTLGAAALEVLCMVHFRISLAHMAAISSQSDKAIQYVNAFFRKLKPYLEANGWRQSSDNKKMVAWLTEEKQEIYIRIVIATIAGANCIDPDSMIETSDGFKKASDVKQGDFLKTHDLWADEDVYVKVMTTGGILSETRELVFDDGSNLITSVKHKVFTQRGWLNTGNLKINDRIISREGFYTKPKKSIADPSSIWNLESMVYGTMLGNANIQKLSSGNCRYQVFHCASQLDYLEEIKKTFLKNNIKSSIVPDKGGFRLYTEVNSFFNEVYRLCFVDGIKTVNENWLSKVNLESLAFLIMDDGTTHRKELGKYKESPIDIAVMGFEDVEIELLIKHIKDIGYYSFKHAFGKHSQIRIPIEESRNLSLDIVGFFVDCLKYKLCFSDDIRFAIDTGNHIDNHHCSRGFAWENKKTMNNKKGRDFNKKMKNKLNKKIIKINNLGTQALVGIGVNPESNFNIKSYYANGVLVHNSEHVPMLFIDEVDVVQDPRALKEAKMIPSTFGHYFPLTVYLSTRKFAGGLMEKTLKETLNAGGEILRWNILDVTERISHDKAQVDQPRKIRYISRELPMESLMEDEWRSLPDEKKHKYERLEAYAGIADHPLLPVMKNYLVDRPQDHSGGLYKKLSATLNNFRQLDSDMADAQLLCNKPASSGLVYPRFDEDKNVLSVQEAWEKISGMDNPCNFNNLQQYLIDLGVTFIGGGDWGFTDYTVLPVLALLPGGEIWLMDTFAMQGLEIDDIAKYGKELQEGWYVDKWYCDQNYPSYLKTLKRKANMLCPKFTKDVAAGIAALQGKIVDSLNMRRFYIIDTPNNKSMISAFGEYRWATDGKGEIIEGKPYHDKDGVSDHMDSIRYPFQNLFTKGGKASFAVAGKQHEEKQKKLVTEASSLTEVAKNVNIDLMKGQITSLATNSAVPSRRNTGKKKILW